MYRPLKLQQAGLLRTAQMNDFQESTGKHMFNCYMLASMELR